MFKQIKTNKEAIDCWNEIIDFINNGKEDIYAKEGTDEYYKEYSEKNPLMKTILQSVNLFNIIFNKDNTDNYNR